MTKRNAAAKILLYLALALAAVYTLTPLVTLVITSVRSETDLYQGPFSMPKQFSGIQNYIRAWTVGRIGVYSFNSIAMTVPAVLLVVYFTTLSGYAFAKIKFPGRMGLFYLLILGMMVPFQAVMIPIYFLMNFLHLLDTRIGVSLIIAIGGLPFGTFMMRAFFRGISDELIEAAKLDGCSEGRLFFSLMLPLTYPAWGSLIIFQAMWTWNNFLVPLLFIYSEQKRPIPLGLMFFQGRYTSEYTVISAAILVAILPLILLYIIFQRRFTTGLTAGAMKG